jgi:hypothetical protein
MTELSSNRHRFALWQGYCLSTAGSIENRTFFVQSALFPLVGVPAVRGGGARRLEAMMTTSKGETTVKVRQQQGDATARAIANWKASQTPERIAHRQAILEQAARDEDRAGEINPELLRARITV